MDKQKSSIRLSLQLPLELNARLEEIAQDLGSTKTDVLRRALALIDVAHEAKKKDKIVGVMSKDYTLEQQFVGL